MKKATKIIAILPILLFTVLLFGSCSDKVKDNPLVPEGKPAILKIAIEQGDRKLKSGLTPAQEQTINNVHVLVFNKAGAKITHAYFNGTINSPLNVTTQSGNNMSVYVVTNLNSTNTQVTPSSSFFDQIASVAELDSMVVRNIAADAEVNKLLVMQGSNIGVTINPQTGSTANQMTIQLHYVAAKVTVNFIKKLAIPTDSANLVNWHLVHYPIKSYIFPQSYDATNVNDTLNSFTSSNGTFAFTDTVFNIGGQRLRGGSATFYLYENRRGTRIQNSTPTSAPNKGLYAPAMSTVFVANGFYDRVADQRVVGMQANIYLGNDSTQDYNIERGKNYTYDITVRGINNYSIDSRFDSVSNVKMEIYNTTLDAHYDYRPLRITSWAGSAKLEILNTDGTPVDPTTSWLKLSRINLMKFVNSGGVWSRPTYNPATDMKTSDTITIANNNVQQTRMFYLYADEDVTPEDTRSVIIKLTNTSTNPAQSFPPIQYTITQRGIQVMGGTFGLRKLNGNGSPTTENYTYGVERIEEATLNLTPGAAAGTEKTATMQFGFNQMIALPTTGGFGDLYYYRNGFEDTQLEVFNGSGNLQQPFGRNSAATGGTTSARINYDTFDPIFNSYPARYCFEKNRDLNGDGVISGSEIKWYLPSIDEYYMLYVDSPFLTSPLGNFNYSVSSEVYGSLTSIESMTFNTATSGPINKTAFLPVRCVRKMTTGTTPVSPFLETGTRIVNNGGFPTVLKRTTPVSCPTPVSSFNSAPNLQVSPRFQIAKTDAVLSGSSVATVMSWSQAAGWNTTADTGGATTVASPATGCNNYSEPGAPAGTWRLPTLREIYIIDMIQGNELTPGTDGYVDLSGYYWSSSQLGGTNGYAYNTLGRYTTFFVKTNTYHARCIRDL